MSSRYEIVNVRMYGVEPAVAIGIEIDDRGGRITHVGERQDWPTIDGGGRPIIVGRIDPHVHDRVPGDGESETLQAIQVAAVYGGTTTIVSQANTHPCMTTTAAVAQKGVLTRPSPLGYYQWLGATRDNFGELAAAKTLPNFKGVKLCMATTTATGDMLVDKKRDQRRWCSVAAEQNVLLTVHAENEARIRRRERYYRQRQVALTLFHHCVIRDPASEVEAVEQILQLALQAGCRLNICHVSVPESITMILAARARGLRVTYELCPHYCLLSGLWLDEEEGWRYKCNPPLRKPESMAAMMTRLCAAADDGAILATDHAPHAREKKIAHYPDPFLVPSGMPGLDTATWLMWDLVRKGKMSPQRFADLTARGPARLLGFTKKGEVTPGYDADLVVIDEVDPRPIWDEQMHTHCGWTPFQRKTVGARAALVVAGGKILLDRLSVVQ